MAEAVLRSAFGGSATPPALFVTMAGHDDMVEGAGVAKPSSNLSTCSMVYNTITPTPDDRIIFDLVGEVKNDFGVVFRSSSTANFQNSGMVYFAIGGSASPAWNIPDTAEIRKYASGVPTTITPLYTANGTPNDHASIVGNVISFRHHRLSGGDKIELMFINDQLIIRINNIPYGREEFTGGIDAAGYSAIVSFSGPSTTQAYDNFKTGSLVGRYVDSAATDDTGTGLDNDPWKTIGKGIVAQAAGEVCFVVGGSYTESLQIYTGGSPGLPRAATSLEDPVMWVAKAGSTVTNTAGNPFLGTGANLKFLICYGITYIGNGGTENYAFKTYDGGFPVVLIGCGFKRANKSGLQFTGQSPSGNEGGHWVMDCTLLGNGWKAGGFDHQIYVTTKDNTYLYNNLDGATAGSGPCLGYGFHIYQSTADALQTSNSIINYNVVHGHLGAGRAGILGARGTNLQIIGNRVYDNAIGINLGLITVDGVVAWNDVYENTESGILLGGANTATGSLCHNNTSVRNGQYGIRNDANSTTAKATNNICYGNTSGQIIDNGTGLTQTTNWTTDPSFENEAADNHRLQTTSPALTGGTDVGPSGLNEIQAVDRLGNPVTTWGHGAYTGTGQGFPSIRRHRSRSFQKMNVFA